MIKINNLGKKYILRHQQSGPAYQTLRDSLYGAARSVGKKIVSPFSSVSSASREEFWALKDVDLEIKQGERVGIIGRNGAGKSTLLKLLSRITEPTTGRIELNGRVASLLEVGTGFHPELSGRENIFLSGAVMGMRRKEIKKKFDEIVAFAEVEKFLDTPVKRYSSGMYVRLAFAVAAHLDPEILLVDEVLAVGDAEFQKKCLGKMEDVSRQQGRTVIFVSHNMAAIAMLCSRAILLDGRMIMDGGVEDVATAYVARFAQNSAERMWADSKTAPGNEFAYLQAVRIRAGKEMTSMIDIQQAFDIEVDFRILKQKHRYSVVMHLVNAYGVTVFASANFPSITDGQPDEWFDKELPAGFYRTVCTVPGCLLAVGTYSINVFIMPDMVPEKTQAYCYKAVSFIINNLNGYCREYTNNWPGEIRPKLKWHTSLSSDMNDN